MTIPALRSCPSRFLVAAFCLLLLTPWGHLRPVRAADDPETWYVPKEADFRPEYDKDQVNQKVQTWNQYSDWIAQFYKGNFASVGWTKQGQACVAPVKSKAVQHELIKLFNELGKDIAKEWAKDNGVRKINTADLNRWGGTLRAAQRADRGTGSALKSTLQAVRAEVDKKLGK